MLRLFLHFSLIYNSYFSQGGHINPAVTLAYATIGRFPWFKVPIYITAQLLGTFLGAGCVYGVYFGKMKISACIIM